MLKASGVTEKDRVLIDLVLDRGDEVAFETLYDRHTPALLQFALRVTGGVRADAEDVVQEAWVRAMKKVDHFRWRSSLRTWLHGIALNVGREQLRRRQASLDRPEALPSHRFGEPSERRLDVERALASLPDNWRFVALLHDVEGYTHRQIAELLDIATGTSKSRLHRARQRLRELLTAGEQGETDDRP